MAERVVLHIGTMKSGTTYLQDVLGSGALEGSGAWFVGGSFHVQNLAVRELLGPERRPTPEWDRLLEEVAGRRGTAVVSHEFLSFMGADRAGEVVTSLPADAVSVVLTVRDQRRAIPAQWQSLTRNRGLDGWEDYQRRLEQPGRSRDPRARRAVRGFRRAQHVPAMLRRWGSLPGVRDVTLVVVPPADAGPAELWQRFCRAVGVDVGLPPTATRRSNQSLGRASCETLVLFNRALEAVPRERFAPWRDHALGALLPLRPEEDAPVLARPGRGAAGAAAQPGHRRGRGAALRRGRRLPRRARSGRRHRAPGADRAAAGRPGAARGARRTRAVAARWRRRHRRHGRGAGRRPRRPPHRR